MTATLTADEQGLLATICDHPAEDAPRLVLADWWEEHGDPQRAEFVRVQCELARLPEEPPMPCSGMTFENRRAALWHSETCEWCRWTHVRDEKILPLRSRERKLWKAADDGRRWFPPAGIGVTATLGSLDWIGRGTAAGLVRRGFVHSVALPLAAFLGGGCGRCGLQWVLNPNLSRPRDVSGCTLCAGSGRTPGAAASLAAHPVERVTFSDAVIHESGGNMTYYVGGLGQWPREYWSSLDNLPSRKAATEALSAAAVAYLRGLRGNL
jgi:uncharacterized protein (TIGR02996 family)